MEVSEAARLKALEDENAKLKRLLADTMLDNVVLKDLRQPGRRPPQAGAPITTPSDRIPRSATRRCSKRAGRLRNLRAPRPARLPHPKPTNINPKDSRYERGTTGGQVVANAVEIPWWHAPGM